MGYGEEFYGEFYHIRIYEKSRSQYDGFYLDIQGGEAVSGAKLIFAPKSGKSSQNFVFDYVW